MRKGLVHWFIIFTFVSLYLIVSIISTIHVVEFFRLSNPEWLAISLAIAFEVGAAASLASLIVLEKMNKFLVWVLFTTLTFMQAMGNTYYAFTNLHDFQSWIELFGLVDEEVIYQKRILSLISGAILPLVALGFIKSLVDYIKPERESKIEIDKEDRSLSSNNTDESIQGQKEILFDGAGASDQFGTDDMQKMENTNEVNEIRGESSESIEVNKDPDQQIQQAIISEEKTQVVNRSEIPEDPILRYKMSLKNNT